MSIGICNDLKFIDPEDPHQIHILFSVLDDGMDLKQENTDGATRLKTYVASLLLEPSQMEEDDLRLYKLEYVIH